MVNLCKEYDDSKLVREAGLVPLHLAILDNSAPPEGMMKQFLDFASDPAHQLTYVHCEAGKGRTGCAVACYRMAIQGWTDQQAIEEGKKFGLQLESQITWLSRSFHADLLAGKLAPYPLKKGAQPQSQLWTLPERGQWTLDKHGQKADPVNVYALGDFQALERALLAAGWTRAAPNNLADNARYVGAFIEWGGVKAEDAAARLHNRVHKEHVKELHLPAHAEKVIASMPVSQQTLEGKPFTAAYEFANNPVGGRHHIRVFESGCKDGKGCRVWCIAATQDVGIMFDPQRPEQGFMNHRVAADTDGERDFLANALQSNGAQVEHRGPIDYGAKNQYGYGPGDSKVVEAAFG